MIGTAGLAVLGVDAAGRLRAEARPALVLDLRPGLRRLAGAVDEFELRHGTRPRDAESLEFLFGGKRHPWTCSRCGLPLVLGSAKSRPGETQEWPFGSELAAPDPDRPAAFCACCNYPDGTTDILTFDGRIGSMARSELNQRSALRDGGR